MSTLARRKCIPCSGGVPRLKPPVIRSLLRKLGGGWRVARNDGAGRSRGVAQLAKEFSTRDFAQGLAFVVDVGRLADREGHHPDIELGWGYVRLRIFTHAIDGLSESDFILAAKIDAISRRHQRMEQARVRKLRRRTSRSA